MLCVLRNVSAWGRGGYSAVFDGEQCFSLRFCVEKKLNNSWSSCCGTIG